MDKAEQFIKDYTNHCSNELCAVEDIHGKKVISYHEWLTPEQALRAVEIAKEGVIEALRTEYEKGRADTIQELQDALVNHQGHTSNDYKKGDVNFISDKEYLDRAIDFIVDREEENDYICEKLHEIPEEFKICSEDCQNLDHWCVLRFLMHYTLKKL